MKALSRLQKKAHDHNLRETFGSMDAGDAQEIRSSYYDAACGLQGLTDKLAEVAADDPALARELEIARKALAAINLSRLGAAL